MQVIEHQELASSQTSIVFNSIPQTFTDLFVLFSLRNDRSTDGASSYAGITINGNYTNLSQRLLQGNGSATASFSYTSGTYPLWVYIPGSGYTASTFQNGSIYIPNYAGSTVKSISVDSVTENNATTAFQTIHNGLYNSSTAITSLGFISLNSDLAAAGNLVQFSSATLYGITKGSSNGVTVS
jgi:hypothetical protein